MEMGERLAHEVKDYIVNACVDVEISKISFIGHSLGGLIVRAALPYLAEYSHLFYTYMTLSSPHLGYLSSSGKLFDAGFWVIKNWKKSMCLTQLTMTD
jgi:triacylglycerol esterase/lipase EstA (alpha/beta hydrolase family)